MKIIQQITVFCVAVDSKNILELGGFYACVAVGSKNILELCGLYATNNRL